MKKKIAIPIDDNGVLDAHFGHCKLIVLTLIQDGKVVSEEKLVPPPHEPGLLPVWLAEKGATDIIAGGMGQKAISLFTQNGVNVFVGAPKLNAEQLLKGFLDKSISFTGNYCDH